MFYEGFSRMGISIANINLSGFDHALSNNLIFYQSEMGDRFLPALTSQQHMLIASMNDINSAIQLMTKSFPTSELSQSVYFFVFFFIKTNFLSSQKVQFNNFLR
jgi:hypothetical protein